MPDIIWWVRDVLSPVNSLQSGYLTPTSYGALNKLLLPRNISITKTQFCRQPSGPHTPRLAWREVLLQSVRPSLSGGNLIYALIILGRLHPAASGQYTAGGGQESEAVADTGRGGKGTTVRESRPRVKRSREIIAATHPTCILTGGNSVRIILKSTTGFSNITMETAGAPRKNYLTTAWKVYRSEAEHVQLGSLWLLIIVISNRLALFRKRKRSVS